MLYRVIKRYQPEKCAVWIARAGEVVKYERKPTIYPEWLWCTNKSGKSAWAPEQWVVIISAGECRFIRDYNACELPVKPGQIVDGEIEVSGWVLISDENKKSGWVPLDYVRKVGEL